MSSTVTAAQALALIVGALGSYLLFDFHLTWSFSLGVSLVIGAVFLYGSTARSPQELCDALGGTRYLELCCPGVVRPAAEVQPADDAKAALIDPDRPSKDSPRLGPTKPADEASKA